ncbi:MAG TPA: PIN domain-containing protein [Solirubrobacteraceae bacterium]|nr:PIN domain-containing protein [Solirubrobacteraceae bacterium]
MSGYGKALLLDSSVWTRLIDGRLPDAERETFEAALAAGKLWTCPPSLLEMRYSARDSQDFALLAEELGAIPHAPLDAEAAAAGVTAQAELAAAPGISHRVKPVDLLIAGIAAMRNLGVLHYDHDYDTIAQHTSLSFSSVWVAPRSSIG